MQSATQEIWSTMVTWQIMQSLLRKTTQIKNKINKNNIKQATKHYMHYNTSWSERLSLTKFVRKASCALNWISKFYYFHRFDTSTGGILIPMGFYPLVGNALVLTWSIRYMDDWNLQIPNNVQCNISQSCLLFRLFAPIDL
jgi:hypothetical protein